MAAQPSTALPSMVADGVNRLIDASHEAFSAGEYDRAVEAAEEAVRLAERHSDPHPRAVANRRLAAMLFNLERFESAMQAVNRARDAAQPLDDHLLTAAVLALRASCYQHFGDVAAAVDDIVEAESHLVGVSEASTLLADTHCNLGTAYMTADLVDLNIEHLDRAVEVARACGDTEASFLFAMNKLQACVNQVTAAEMSGDAHAQAAYAKLADECDAFRAGLDPQRHAMIDYELRLASSFCSIRAGDTERGLHTIAGIAPEDDVLSANRAHLRHALGLARLAVGDLAAARRLLEGAKREAETATWPFRVTVIRHDLVRLGELADDKELVAGELRAISDTYLRAYWSGRRFQAETIRARIGLHDVRRRAAELAISAHTDAVTGLATRRYLERQLDALILEARESGRPLSLAMLDLDRLKQVNDHHGHAAGDACLHGVADAIRSATRDGDLAGRYGGDEFVVVLPNTAVRAAQRVASRIRSAAARVDLTQKGVTIQISVGIAELDKHADRAELVATADLALYDAKRAGGDRISRARRRPARVAR